MKLLIILSWLFIFSKSASAQTIGTLIPRLNEAIYKDKPITHSEAKRIRILIGSALSEAEKRGKIDGKTYSAVLLITAISEMNSEIKNTIDVDSFWARISNPKFKVFPLKIEARFLNFLKQYLDVLSYRNVLDALQLKFDKYNLGKQYHPTFQYRCKFYTEIGSFQVADACWKKIEKISKSTEFTSAHSIFSKVSAYLTRAEFKTALDLLNKVDVSKKNKDFRTKHGYMKARALFFSGKHEEAIKLTKETFGSNPNKIGKAYIDVLSAEIAASKNDCPASLSAVKAIEDLGLDAKSLEPIRRGLTYIYLSCGNPTRAQFHLEKSLEIAESGPFAQLIERVAMVVLKKLNKQKVSAKDITFFNSYGELFKALKLNDPLGDSFVKIGKVISSAKSISQIPWNQVRKDSEVLRKNYQRGTLTQVILDRMLEIKE